MAADPPLYDLVLLLDADAPSERRTDILSEVEKTISGAGSIEGKHDWGVRALTFEIQHRTEAEYHLFQFKGSAELLERLRTALKVTDGVLRHRIIRLEPGTPPPPAMRAERPAPAAEAPPVPETPAAEPDPAEAPAPAGEPEAPAAPPAEPSPPEPAPEGDPAETAQSA